MGSEMCIRDRLKKLLAKHSDLKKDHNDLQQDASKNEKTWTETIHQYRSIEAELRAHIRKLEQMVAKELRHARQGLLSRIGDMEATLAEERMHSDRLDKVANENTMTIVKTKAS